MRRFLTAAGLIALLAGCGRAENTLLLLEDLPDVASITIEGNEVVSDGALKKVMTTKEKAWWNPFRDATFRKSQFATDLNAIITYYRRRGYLRAEIASQEVRRSDDTVHITIRVTEGEPVMISRIALVGAKEVDRSHLESKLSLKTGKPLDPFLLEEDKRALLRELADRGRWEAKVDGNAQIFGDSAVVLFAVKEGAPVVASRVDVTWNGPRTLKESVVRRDIAVRPGEELRWTRLERSQSRLLQSGYFADARWDTLDADTLGHRVAVDFQVRERRLRWWEAGIGISSEERVRLNGEWGTRDFLGTGMRYALSSRADFDVTGQLKRNLGLDEIRSQMFLNRRHLLGTLWEGQTSLTYIHDPEIAENVNSEYIQNIVELGFSARRTFGDLRNQIIFSLENRWVVNDAESLAQASDVALFRDSYQTRLLSAWVERDTRNDFFTPTRGVYRSALFQFAGGALGGNNGFVKGVAALTRLQAIRGESWILAGRVQAGYVGPTSDALTLAGRPVTAKVELIPNEDRFFLGGANTLRGYEQNAVDGTDPADTTSGQPEGGLATVLVNLELRFPLWGRFSGVTFVDAGNVWPSIGRFQNTHWIPQGRSGVDPADLRYSFGAGVRFATPLGPVRLDYAWRWNVPEGIDEKRSRLHVAVGHAF